MFRFMWWGYKWALIMLGAVALVALIAGVCVLGAIVWLSARGIESAVGSIQTRRAA